MSETTSTDPRIRPVGGRARKVVLVKAPLWELVRQEAERERRTITAQVALLLERALGRQP